MQMKLYKSAPTPASSPNDVLEIVDDDVNVTTPSQIAEVNCIVFFSIIKYSKLNLYNSNLNVSGFVSTTQSTLRGTTQIPS